MVSVYQHGWEAAFFAKRAVDLQHRGYATVEGFEVFAEALWKVLHSVVYPDILPQCSTGESLRFMHSIFESQESLKEEEKLMIGNSTTSRGDERRDCRG